MKYTRAIRIFRAIVGEADRYQQQPSQADALARRAEVRAEKHRGPLHRVWDDLTTFFRLLRAWARGHYRLAPWKTVSLIIGAVVYFMSPIDMIPDLLPGLGFLDDAFIIGWVMRSVRQDVDDFRRWESV
jgi:uncharacterized membrane protein YkvA (DUF1232 family)